MAFTIRITKTESYQTRRQDYQKIADSGNPKDKGAIYDYVDHESTQEREVELFKQTMESLNLLAVISAANGLPAAPIQEEK